MKPHYSPTQVTDRLRAERQRLRISQQTVADSLGVTQACISRWETLDNNPPLDMVMDWARVLGLTVEVI
jgi:transcriptional regulator with XRE-family HTH domain